MSYQIFTKHHLNTSSSVCVQFTILNITETFMKLSQLHIGRGDIWIKGLCAIWKSNKGYGRKWVGDKNE